MRLGLRSRLRMRLGLRSHLGLRPCLLLGSGLRTHLWLRPGLLRRPCLRLAALLRFRSCLLLRSRTGLSGRGACLGLPGSRCRLGVVLQFWTSRRFRMIRRLGGPGRVLLRNRTLLR